MGYINQLITGGAHIVCIYLAELSHAREHFSALRRRQEMGCFKTYPLVLLQFANLKIAYL